MYKDIGSLKKHIGRVNYDVLRDEKKMPHYAYSIGRQPEAKVNYCIDIPYGGVATCLYCGNKFEDEGYDSLLLCPNCEYVRCCPLCGEPLTGDSVWIEELDENICYDCYEDKTVVDNFTDEVHLSDNMDSLCLLLGYDTDNRPVYYDCWVYIYDMEHNYGYDEIFTDLPKNEYYHNYVTFDMIKEGATSDFCRVFEIYPRNLNKFYSDAIDDFGLVYDYNHNLLFEDEEENA